MDKYPKRLSPGFTESGAIRMPFAEWWVKVQLHFPTVPENVARYWLHEHWNHSPYGWLPSRNYRFTLIDWQSENLPLIRSRWSRWKTEGCLVHGQHLIEEVIKYGYTTARYMLDRGDFPAPIIILDNKDGHIRAGRGNVSAREELPEAYVLIEGHRRFNMALYLQQTGRLKPVTQVWLMQRTASSNHSAR